MQTTKSKGKATSPFMKKKPVFEKQMAPLNKKDNILTRQTKDSYPLSAARSHSYSPAQVEPVKLAEELPFDCAAPIEHAYQNTTALMQKLSSSEEYG